MSFAPGQRVLFVLALASGMPWGVGAGQTGASVTGRIVDSTRTPLRNALVTLRVGSTDVATAPTTRDGTFAFHALPSGRYSVVASKPGYLQMTYGARRFGGLGVPLAVTEGSRHDVEISLPQAAVIAGQVTMGLNDPASGMSINAIRLRDGEPAESVGVAKTDSHGRFRVLGLPPGDYAIRANEPLLSSDGKITKLSEADVDRLIAALSKGETPSLPATTSASVSYAPTYFPGVASFDDAVRVTVAEGDVREGIDIRFAPVHLARLDGSVSPVSDASGVQVVLLSAQGDAVSPRRATQPNSTGAFAFDDVLPGHYTVLARASARQSIEVRNDDSRIPIVRRAAADARATASTEFLYGSADVDVYDAGSAYVPVSVSLAPGATMAGRIVVDGAQPLRPEVLRTLTVTLIPAQPSGRSLLIGGADFTVAREVAITDAGTFNIAGIAPGRYDFRVNPEPRSGGSPLWLRSVVSGSHDFLDDSLLIDSSHPKSEVTVTLSALHTSVGGRLVTTTGEAAQDCVVVIFSADPSQWGASSRRTRILRSGTDGVFNEPDLPPGEYVLAALLDLDPATLAKGVPFDDLAAAGVHFALREGQQLAIGDLRAGG